MHSSDKKITISTEDVGGDRPLRIELPPQEPPPPATSQSTTSLPQPEQSLRLSEPASRLSSRTQWVITISAVMLALALGVTMFFIPRETERWTERLAKAADRSVVRIDIPGSMGTGFVVASHGNRHLILTNRHVIGEYRQVRVTNRAGNKVLGNVVGLPHDTEVDLALIEVKSSQLEPLGGIGRFTLVRNGMEVAAIGHPLGLDYTITDGIVSAKREGLYIQTSAAISQGNSGGPLLDRDGNIVGINTMIIRPDVGNSLGFAIRADYLLDRRKWHYSGTIADLLDRVEK